jgi:hypothetical protein
MGFDSRVVVWLVPLLSLLGAGCHHVVGSDPLGDAGSDTDTDTDTGPDADTDSDTDADADGGADGGAVGPYQIGVGGFLDLDFRNRGELLGFSALAQFFDVTDPYILHQSEEVLVAADGVDTCELAYFDGSSGWAEGTLEWLTAGIVTLSSGGDEAVLDEYEGGLVVNYYADLMSLELTPRYGEEYALSVSGDAAAGFEIAPLFVLPALLDIEAPALDATLPRAALAIAWTGATGSGLARVRLKASDASSTGVDHYEIDCAVVDDGEFEIPGELMEALPAGWQVELVVSRSQRVVHPIPGDLDFIATAESSSVGEHLLEE